MQEVKNQNMPVYESEEYKEVITRIKDKIAHLNIKMGSTLSEKDIKNFEEHCSIKLSSAYRIFLKEVGDGCDSMTYHLIVSGKCRGEVWQFSDVGVQPLCERQDFFGWFEAWLDYGNQVDYFKDYAYHV